MEFQDVIGSIVKVTVDRPLGSRHPRFPGMVYEVNSSALLLSSPKNALKPALLRMSTYLCSLSLFIRIIV